MESSDRSFKTASEPPPPTLPQGWSGILGITIAILTLIIPTLAIVYYSSGSIQDSVLRTALPTSSQNRSQKARY